MMRGATVALMAACLVAGCGGGGWWPFGESTPDPAARIPAGATPYTCAGGKTLYVRYASDGKSAWVIYPDREFRLDRVESGGGETYTNRITTLIRNGDAATLDEENARVFNDCKRGQGGN